MIQNKEMKISEFNVLHNYIVVNPKELDKGEVKTSTGLILDTEQNQSIIDRPSTGEVILTGPDIETIKVGNTVVWVESDGLEMEFEDGIFLILRENSILGYKSWVHS